MQPDRRSCNKTPHRTVAASSILSRCKLILYKTMLLTRPVLMAHWRELESCSVMEEFLWKFLLDFVLAARAGGFVCSVPLQGQEAEEEPGAPHRGSQGSIFLMRDAAMEQGSNETPKDSQQSHFSLEHHFKLISGAGHSIA